ncbi:class I SAM-dependent methyltransferase [Qipengyuania sp.]|uniref:class I SAM-dependent methyltransferase n=1 Tax=Qipengyuania sp. TaxID=2004515 RepID=UPI0035C87C5C
MTDTREWTGRVGSSWAEQWQRTDRSFRALTPHLLDAARAGPFAHALDIGCGAGEITCALASADGRAHVTGVDISEDLLDVARTRCGSLPNTAFALADAGSFTPPHGPDLLVSRHGVMFFADPVAAFSHLAERAARDARLVFSCFRARAKNEWVGAVMGVLDDPPAPPADDPGAPGPFAFADRDRVADLLARAGWRDTAFHALDYPMIFGEGADSVADAIDYLLHIGPLASALANLGDEARRTALERLGDLLENAREGNRVSLPAAAWIVTARTQ